MSALETARRLQQMGVVVRSAELAEEQKRQEHFAAHGNRALRRRAARAARRKRAS